MAVAYILATFACMLVIVVAILIGCYAAMRSWWIAVVACAVAAIVAIGLMEHFADEIERSYRETIASAKGTADD